MWIQNFESAKDILKNKIGYIALNKEENKVYFFTLKSEIKTLIEQNFFQKLESEIQDKDFLKKTKAFIDIPKMQKRILIGNWKIVQIRYLNVNLIKGWWK